MKVQKARGEGRREEKERREEKGRKRIKELKIKEEETR